MLLPCCLNCRWLTAVHDIAYSMGKWLPICFLACAGCNLQHRLIALEGRRGCRQPHGASICHGLQLNEH